MNGASLETVSNESNGGESLSEARLFDLLGNERRRSCLQCLAVVEGTITVQDLASQVAARVSDEGRSPDEIRDSVYISLCQNHLPKLEDAGVVNYDVADKIVGPGPAFPAVERHLGVDAADTAAPDSTRYCLLASLVTVLVLGTAAYAAPAALSYAVPAVLVLHGVAVLTMGRRLL